MKLFIHSQTSSVGWNYLSIAKYQDFTWIGADISST